MPEAGQDPEKSGPLLTPRGKALVRKIALLPLWPVIWVGRAIWAQHDRLYAWTTKAWEMRHQQPPAKTYGEFARQIALWPLHGYLALGRAAGRRIEAWWTGSPPPQAPAAPAAAPPPKPAAEARPTLSDRFDALTMKAQAALESGRKALAEWQAKRAAECAEAEKQEADKRAEAAKQAAAKKTVEEKQAAAKPVQKPSAHGKPAAPPDDDEIGMVNGVPISQFPEDFRELAEVVAFLNVQEAVRKHMIGLLERRQLQELKTYLEYNILPYLPDADRREILENTGTGARWASNVEMKASGLAVHSSKRPPDVLYLGSYPVAPGKDSMMHFSGEGHLITVAPTGAGKTAGHVLPAAVYYKGPIVCFDPKGEVYRNSAWARRESGNVIKWAPYETNFEGDGFNPLDFVRSYSDATALAHMLIPSPPAGVDPFWVEATRDLVAGGLWFEILTKPPGEATIAGVYRRLNNLRRKIPNQFDDQGRPIIVTRLMSFREELILTGDPNLEDLAESLEDMEDNEKQLTSYSAHMRANMAIWAQPEIEKATSRTRREFNPQAIWLDGRIADFMYRPGGYNPKDEGIQPGYHSVFLIVPPTKVDVTAPVVRVILNTIINEMLTEASNNKEDPPDRKVTYCPVLFLIDEFPQLGYMDVIEKSIAIVRYANLRFWLFVQDLNQLRTTYPKWQSILANTRVKLYFQCNDMETAEEVSKLVGERREFFSGKSRRLATPQELMGQEFAGKQIIKLAGYNPVKADLAMMHKYPDHVEYVRLMRNDNARDDIPE